MYTEGMEARPGDHAAFWQKQCKQQCDCSTLLCCEFAVVTLVNCYIVKKRFSN